MVLYCVYCGQDKNDGHHKDCPLIAGIPKFAMGFAPREGDVEFNLNLGRVSQLGAIRKTKEGELDMSTGDPKRDYRLAYEQTAFQIRRIIPELSNAQQKLNIAQHKNMKGIFGWLTKSELNKANKQLKEVEGRIAKIYHVAKLYGISKEEVDEIWNQKVILADFSGESHIAAFRDSETKKVTYMSVKQ